MKTMKMILLKPGEILTLSRSSMHTFSGWKCSTPPAGHKRKQNHNPIKWVRQMTCHNTNKTRAAFDFTINTSVFASKISSSSQRSQADLLELTLNYKNPKEIRKKERPKSWSKKKIYSPLSSATVSLPNRLLKLLLGRQDTGLILPCFIK